MKYAALSRAAIAAFGAAWLAGCLGVPLSGLYGRSELVEETVVPADRFLTANKIALISISGTLQGGEAQSSFFGSDSSVVSVKDQIKQAKKDPLIKAIVVRIDSPGGEVTASDIIYRELKELKKETEVPMLASIVSLGASGGYYVAMAADKVYAHPTALTGSIGVVFMLPQLDGLTRKIGVDVRVIKSGDAKDFGSLWRAFVPGEREMFQAIIDSMHERFIAVVAEGRPKLSEKEIRKLADGRPYTAEQALELGLIDGLQYLDETIEEAKTAAGIRDARVVIYRKPLAYKGHIYANSGVSGPQAALSIDAGEWLESLTQPRFLYLWAP